MPKDLRKDLLFKTKSKRISTKSISNNVTTKCESVSVLCMFFCLFHIVCFLYIYMCIRRAPLTPFLFYSGCVWKLPSVSSLSQSLSLSLSLLLCCYLVLVLCCSISCCFFPQFSFIFRYFNHHFVWIQYRECWIFVILPVSPLHKPYIKC